LLAENNPLHLFRKQCPPRVIPPHVEGRTSSRYVECGLRWTLKRCARERSQGGLKLCLGAVSDCFPRRTSGVVAYGKTVWSWRPWLASSFAKTKFARPGPGFAVNSQGDGGKRNSSPGRARHKPSSHCAGKAGCSPLDLYARVRAFCAHCTRDRGCSAHPVFPAPSRLRRAERAGTTRARCAARTRWHIRL